jgi:TolB protein
LNGIEEKIGNMDMTLSYDPSILEATGVIKGGLTENSLFDSNIMDGTIKISLADNEGFSGDGSIAYVNFNVIGVEGSSSPLQIAAMMANKANDYDELDIQTNDGEFRVISIEEGMGDGDGDGEYTALDALYALQMAVEKIPQDPVMDINEDGSVTSLDARGILKNAVGE